MSKATITITTATETFPQTVHICSFPSQKKF